MVHIIEGRILQT